MDKKLSFWSIALFAFLYFVAVFISAFFGFAAPWAWVFFPAVAALLAAFPYRWLALRWHKFGLATLLASVVALLCLAMGEMDLLSAAIVIVFGLLSDLVAFSGKDWLSYPLLALGNIAWILKLWTAPQWYHDGAVAEMGQDYADALLPYSAPGWLAASAAAVIVAALVGLTVAKRIIKK